jgi:beta-aspartyl-peptidase (threonine type)
VRALLTAPLLLALACRAPAAEETSVDPLLAVVRAQEAAWNSGSVEAFMAAGYWQSDELTFLSAGDWSRGYDDVLARYSARYTEGGAEMGHLTFSELEAQRYSADVGLVRGRWRLEFGSAEPLSGLFTLVLRRLPEGWRIVHDHTSVAEPHGGGS